MRIDRGRDFQVAQTRTDAHTDAEGRRLSGAERFSYDQETKRTTKNTAAGRLLGVNGICIIAHGASTPLAIKNALRVAAESIEQQVNPHIVEEIRRYNETTAPLEPALR